MSEAENEYAETASAEAPAAEAPVEAPESAEEAPAADAPTPAVEGPGALPDGSWHADVNSAHAADVAALVKEGAVMHAGLSGSPDEAQVEALAAAAEAALNTGAFGEGPFSVKVSGHAGGIDTGYLSIHVRDAAENE